ncbi:hypothetical protein BCR44DRAFT_1424447 [Catenaria anguillulae PL171]|uniref:Uncharacterized protein n=1 Tax=Catenaria anguillulae PL171 TaxID=765915 RepID=A0A1Y2I4J3_9FUNG|nr:hypothetical protein BCR44DRAFT_1424447 [Catenaria anguillulae PL171]
MGIMGTCPAAWVACVKRLVEARVVVAVEVAGGGDECGTDERVVYEQPGEVKLDVGSRVQACADAEGMFRKSTCLACAANP